MPTRPSVSRKRMHAMTEILAQQDDWSVVNQTVGETAFNTVQAELLERVRAAQCSQAALVALLNSPLFCAGGNQQVFVTVSHAVVLLCSCSLHCGPVDGQKVGLVHLQGDAGSRVGEEGPVADVQPCEASAGQPVQPPSNGMRTPKRVPPICSSSDVVLLALASPPLTPT